MSWLPGTPEDLFGDGATEAQAYDLLTVDVPAERWVAALTAARDELGCTFFDWLSAVDEPGTGFRVCAHVAALGTPPRRLLLRTTVPHDAPALPTATGVYPGAAWHERETHEMFGVGFPGHPGLDPLLLPEGFEGHPLRKDFVLAARVVKAWPGAKEPGEPGHGGPKRRQMLPPGVPDPNEWGPLKGRLPEPPARRRPAATRGGPGERPRRTRTAGDGSASQRDADTRPEAEATPAEQPGNRRDTAGTSRPRRTRSAREGSASRRDTAAGPPETPAGPRPADGPPPRPAARRGADAPWHQARREPPGPAAGSTPPPTGDQAATDQDTGRPGSGTPAGRPDAPAADGPGTGEESAPPGSGPPDSRRRAAPKPEGGSRPPRPGGAPDPAEDAQDGEGT